MSDLKSHSTTLIGYSGNIIFAIKNCCGFAAFALDVPSGMARHLAQYVYRLVGERIPHIPEYRHILLIEQNTAL